MSFDQLESKAKEEAESNNNSGGGSSSDREELPYVNASPSVAFTYDEIERIVSMSYPTTKEGEVQENTGDIGVILTNPGVVSETGAAIYENNYRDGGFARENDDAPRGHTVDYKVVDQTDDSFDVSYDQDGNPKEVKAGRADPFEGTEVTEFEEDKILAFFGGLAGRRLARTLDVNGRPGARVTDDGQHTQGLVEYTPDGVNEGDDEDNYRYARYPQMRDVDWSKGEGGGFIYLTYLANILPDYDGNGHGVIVGHNDFEGDAVHEATQLEPQYAPDEVEYTDYELLWRSTDGLSSDDSGSDSDEGTDGDFDFGDADDDAESENDLTDSEQNFADGFLEQVGGLDEGETIEDMYDDGEEAFVSLVEEQLGEDADAQAIIEYVEG